jgi:hypothetical protein
LNSRDKKNKSFAVLLFIFFTSVTALSLGKSF